MIFDWIVKPVNLNLAIDLNKFIRILESITDDDLIETGSSNAIYKGVVVLAP